jgi:hypothetical protein
MDFVTSKIADKINISINQETSSNQKTSSVQNGFDAVNDATEKMASNIVQNAGRKKKFRLTKKSRGQSKVK